MKGFTKNREGNVDFYSPIDEKVSKKLDVFYNPLMSLNRDISVLLLNAINLKKMQIGLPLAGTGIRGLRFLKELKKGVAEIIDMNDLNPDFEKYVNENIKLNDGIDKKKLGVFNLDANIFLLNSRGYDYIDIDPFGTPNPFLDSAIRRLSRRGILGVTATDTSALAGTYLNACKRKYWAVPIRNELKHEIGLRILIRKVQLVGAQFDRALVPILSYSKDHYYRVFFKSIKGKEKVDTLLKQHTNFEFLGKEYGPIFNGKLHDKTIANKMIKILGDMTLENNKTVEKLLNLIYQESGSNQVGFYDIHSVCKRNKIKDIPKLDLIKKDLKKKNYPTHTCPTAIKCNISEQELVKIIKKINTKNKK